MAHEKDIIGNAQAVLARSAWKFAGPEADPAIRASLEKINPAALRTLLGVAFNASCLEEIQIILRYQQGRDRQNWKEDLVQALEKEMIAVARTAGAGDTDDRNAAKRAAEWLGYVVRLHRYLHENARASQGGGH